MDEIVVTEDIISETAEKGQVKIRGLFARTGKSHRRQKMAHKMLVIWLYSFARLISLFKSLTVVHFLVMLC